MRRGNRPGNEYVEKRQRRQPPAKPSGLTPLRPEVRIERPAYIEPCYATHDWGEALNSIGYENRATGMVRSLGSVAITLVPATELGFMIEKKYPRAYRERDATIDILNGIRKGFREFTRALFDAGYHGETLKMASRVSLRDSDMLVAGFSNELEAGDNFEIQQTQVQCTDELSLAHNGKSAELIPFTARSFTVGRRLHAFNRRYGLDLSANEILFEEHRLAVDYLRREEGLDTSYLEHSEFMPHANIFNLKDHIAAAKLNAIPELPLEMEFQAARASVSY